MTLEGQGQVGQRAQRDEDGAGVGGGQIAIETRNVAGERAEVVRMLASHAPEPVRPVDGGRDADGRVPQWRRRAHRHRQVAAAHGIEDRQQVVGDVLQRVVAGHRAEAQHLDRVASLAQEPGDGRRIVHADVGIDDQ
jgi:hypothetical protein